MSVNEVKLKKAKTEFEVRGTGDPSSRTFAIGDEDHTLGNALRHVLLNHSQIGFAGYSVPHPSEPVVHVRVQTLSKQQKCSDAGDSNGTSGVGKLTAIEALKDAALTLHDACDFLLEEVEKILPEVKEDRIFIEQYQESNYFMAEDQEEEVMEGEDYDMEEAY